MIFAVFHSKITSLYSKIREMDVAPLDLHPEYIYVRVYRYNIFYNIYITDEYINKFI